MTDNKDKNVLNSLIEREQNDSICSAECEKIKGSCFTISGVYGGVGNGITSRYSHYKSKIRSASEYFYLYRPRSC